MSAAAAAALEGGVIRVVGAREHNLKSVDLELPRGRMSVFTGLSGSGKSSLAFDTLYAEGQRRYVESLSAYARQFLELMDKPDVDLIEGLSPAVSIEQRNPSRNPRSTVATVTEVYDHLRLLYARAGTPHCPRCGKRVQGRSAASIVREILRERAGLRVAVYSPLVRGRQGTYEELFARLRRSGFAKVRVNGTLHELDSVPKLKRYDKHLIELLIDKVTAEDAERERLGDSVEIALKESGGLVQIEPADAGGGRGVLYSERHSCAECGTSLSELEPRLFSFNSPYGACPGCDGLGVNTVVDVDLVVPDPSLSVSEGALSAWSDPVTTRTHRWKRSWSGYYNEILKQVCRAQKIPMGRPFRTLTARQKEVLFNGGGTYKVHWAKNRSEFEGVVKNLERRLRETESDFVKEEIARRFMREIVCSRCRGARLKEEALHVKVGGLSIV